MQLEIMKSYMEELRKACVLEHLELEVSHTDAAIWLTGRRQERRRGDGTSDSHTLFTIELITQTNINSNIGDIYVYDLISAHIITKTNIADPNSISIIRSALP